MIDSELSDSAEYGVLADRRATLRNSSVAGSALSDFTKPHMRSSTCETGAVAHGLVVPPYTDWDVCTLDSAVILGIRGFRTFRVI